MPHSYPPKGTDLPLPPPSPDLQERLLNRRSVVAGNMTAPGPDVETLDKMLAMAARVPDHGKLAPWRFILFQGDDRASFGETLAKAFAASNPECPDKLVAFERCRFERAPLVIGVVSSPIVPHPKIPEWEQILSAGAVCQNLLLAANAFGFSAQWLTEWYAYDQTVLADLGLAAHEKIAGYIYVGTATQMPCERDRPHLADKVQAYSAAGGR